MCVLLNIYIEVQEIFILELLKIVHLILTTIPGRFYYYHYLFTDVASETHRGYVIFLKITQIVISENAVNQTRKILGTSR